MGGSKVLFSLMEWQNRTFLPQIQATSHSQMLFLRAGNTQEQGEGQIRGVQWEWQSASFPLMDNLAWIQPIKVQYTLRKQMDTFH